MRCEVNISLSKDDKLGTKVEIKNLNSFRAVEKSIDFEIQRQKNLLEKGEKVIQETRGWDADKEVTYSQRWKEEAQDYRYFPEPDLPILHVHSEKDEMGLFDLEELKKKMPETPWQQKEKIKNSYGISSKDANLFIQDEKLAVFFEKIVEEFKEIKLKNKAISLAFNYISSDLKGLMESESISWDNLKINSQNFSQLIILLLEDKISSRVAKDLLLEIAKKGGGPEEKIKTIVTGIIKNNLTAVEDYKKGKTNVIQFLVGQAMAKTRGAAAPATLEKLFKEQLG